MARVRDLITHILHHVNAEAATSDQSQVAGASRRAQLVRDAVQSFVTDNRDLTLRDILVAVYNAIPNRAGRASLRRALVNMRDAGDTRPRLAIQAWVGKNQETRSG